MQPEFPLDSRVLVLAPTRRDGDITLTLLAEADMYGEVFPAMSELVTQLQKGAGVIILTDHGSTMGEYDVLRSALSRQETWSELPVIALAKGESTCPQELRSLPGLVLLERPVQTRTLLSAVEAGLRARQRQYRLRDQLDRIQVANAQLAESTRAKDHFLAILAHELRNPLSAMANAVHLIRATGGGQVGTRAYGVMERQLEQMTRLLDDLLDISRITTNKVQLHRQSCDLNDIVKAAVETARPMIEARQHRLTLNLSPTPVMVDVDSVRIAQVLGNLLTNAAKYTNSGGAIELTSAWSDGRALLTVSDNGIGIPSDSLETIFGMFSQLKPALDAARGGLGIGLALARGIATLHGGTLTAHSDGVGLGSTFVMSLPLTSNTERSILRGPLPEATESQSPRRILVADDNMDGRDTLSDLLRLEGHTVESARDGHDAAKKFGAFRPDIALLDIGMPGMNGYELARHLRARDRAVTLVALTGWGQASDRAAAFEAGFDHHLTKPVDIAALRAVLAKPAARPVTS